MESDDQAGYKIDPLEVVNFFLIKELRDIYPSFRV